MVVITLLGALVGTLVRKPQSLPAPFAFPDPLSLPPSPGTGRCRCGCVGLAVRNAHLEERVAYWRDRAEGIPA